MFASGANDVRIRSPSCMRPYSTPTRPMPLTWTRSAASNPVAPTTSGVWIASMLANVRAPSPSCAGFPTGIGYGVAVPHGKTPVVPTLVVVAGTTQKPVPYETIDGQPVRLFFLLAGPESQAGAHVKAISRISRLVRQEPVRVRLLAAQTPDEFYRSLCEAEGGS